MRNFTITKGKVSFTLTNMDEVLETMEEHNIDINDDEVVIKKVVSTDISSNVADLIKSNLEMTEMRTKNRKEHDLKQFSSQFMENDFELPYDFDLVFDIKSKGHLSYIIKSDGFLNDNIHELCLSYGYTSDYLKSLELIKID